MQQTADVEILWITVDVAAECLPAYGSFFSSAVTVGVLGVLGVLGALGALGVTVVLLLLLFVVLPTVCEPLLLVDATVEFDFVDSAAFAAFAASSACLFASAAATAA